MDSDEDLNELWRIYMSETAMDVNSSFSDGFEPVGRFQEGDVAMTPRFIRAGSILALTPEDQVPLEFQGGVQVPGEYNMDRDPIRFRTEVDLMMFGEPPNRIIRRPPGPSGSHFDHRPMPESAREARAERMARFQEQFQQYQFPRARNAREARELERQRQPEMYPARWVDDEPQRLPVPQSPSLATPEQLFPALAGLENKSTGELIELIELMARDWMQLNEIHNRRATRNHWCPEYEGNQERYNSGFKVLRLRGRNHEESVYPQEVPPHNQRIL